jgi:hypothetical protein
MADCIDPAGKAGNDGDARPCEGEGEGMRHLPAIAIHFARTHHGDRWANGQLTPAIKKWRGQGQVVELPWIFGISTGQDPAAVAFCLQFLSGGESRCVWSQAQG